MWAPCLGLWCPQVWNEIVKGCTTQKEKKIKGLWYGSAFPFDQSGAASNCLTATFKSWFYFRVLHFAAFSGLSRKWKNAHIFFKKRHNKLSGAWVPHLCLLICQLQSIGMKANSWVIFSLHRTIPIRERECMQFLDFVTHSCLGKDIFPTPDNEVLHSMPSSSGDGLNFRN